MIQGALKMKKKLISFLNLLDVLQQHVAMARHRVANWGEILYEIATFYLLLIDFFGKKHPVKFRHSEKATKFEKKYPT